MLLLFLLFTWSSACLNSTAMLGLGADMQAVIGTATHCHSHQDCIEKLCIINDDPRVAWVVINFNV